MNNPPMSNDAVEQGRESEFGEAAVQALVPESLFQVLGASGEPSISHIHAQAMQPGKTIKWPPDSDPLCELGCMAEESALYQVDEIAA
ncbi:hypothetical protein ACHAPX_006058 [Trichoderma viride]